MKCKEFCLAEGHTPFVQRLYLIPSKFGMGATSPSSLSSSLAYSHRLNFLIASLASLTLSAFLISVYNEAILPYAIEVASQLGFVAPLLAARVNSRLTQPMRRSRREAALRALPDHSPKLPLVIGLPALVTLMSADPPVFRSVDDPGQFW